MRKYLLVIFTLITGYGYSQNIDLLNKISDLQRRGDTFYEDGLFPSLRSLGKEKNVREDTLFEDIQWWQNIPQQG